MVNTFLLYSDYRESAKKLDRARLGKQRVEAYQILNLITDLSILSQGYNWPMPEDNKQWKIWVKEIAGKYKKSNHKFIVESEKLIQVDKSTTRDDLSTGQRLITLGFVHHPIVRAWLGWPESLKMYINAHIDEWKARGYKNTMVKYQIESNVVHPPWVTDSNIHKNHYSSLLKKEKERQEKPWYIGMNLYVVSEFEEYIWPV
jgi:hypothetical protein